jgi:lysophospholipase L1-like esterase
MRPREGTLGSKTLDIANPMAKQTLALIGDSILDNDPYTRPEPNTTAHLQRLLTDWSIHRLAQDGARMADIQFQLRELEGCLDTAILSVGGNDAVEHIGLLERRASSSAEVLQQLLGIADEFARRYEGVARRVLEHAKRTVLCTIYEVRLEPPVYADLARVPLGLLNDRIIQVGSRLGVDVLDLRSVCTDSSDFVLQIEPSAKGAEKIARAIAGLVAGNRELTSARVFAA